MKIMHIISSTSSGGAEVFVRDLAIHQAAQEQVVIVAMSKGLDLEFHHNYEKAVRRNNIKLVILRKREKRSKFETIRYLREIIDETKPSVINFHHEYIAFYLKVALMNRKVCVIQTVHSIKFKYPIIYKVPAFFPTSGFIAVSSEVKKKMLTSNTKLDAMINTIPNGINLSNFHIINKHSNVDIKLINVARLHRFKNHSCIIEALRILRQKGLVLKMMFVGEGPEMKKLMTLVNKYKMNDQIAFLGLRHDVPVLLSASDIFITASFVEGLPLSIIEAMASGLTIIASSIKPHKEILEDGSFGILFEVNNAGDLANKIERVYFDNTLRKTLRQKCIRKATDYDIRKTALETVNLYKKHIQ